MGAVCIVHGCMMRSVTAVCVKSCGIVAESSRQRRPSHPSGPVGHIGPVEAGRRTGGCPTWAMGRHRGCGTFVERRRRFPSSMGAASSGFQKMPPLTGLACGCVRGGVENSPAIHGWEPAQQDKASPERDGRGSFVPTGLGGSSGTSPSAKALGYFHGPCASRFGLRQPSTALIRSRNAKAADDLRSPKGRATRRRTDRKRFLFSGGALIDFIAFSLAQHHRRLFRPSSGESGPAAGSAFFLVVRFQAIQSAHQSVPLDERLP